jgi:hypothetical protein
MPRFVGLALERVLILATWPVYNVQGNRWNPRRIKPARARAQARHGRIYTYRARLSDAALVLAGVGLIVAGVMVR